jgi:hypothetical protein
MPGNTDNTNNVPLDAWRQRTLRYAERLAQDFATSPAGRTRVPFDDGSMMDPPFKATLMNHCTNPDHAARAARNARFDAEGHRRGGARIQY